MIKKRNINLLITKEDYKRYEILFQKLKIISLLLSIFFFLFSFFLLKKIYDKNNELRSLLKEKNLLSDQLNKKNSNIAKFNIFKERYSYLTKSLEDDANFLPYYNLLLNSLSEATISAKIKKFEINKKREIQFIINFENFLELMNFFKYIESKNFLDNFDWLNLKNFNLISDSKLIQNYELVFSGKFRKKYEIQPQN